MKYYMSNMAWEIELEKKYKDCGLDVIEIYRLEKYYPIINFKTYYKTDIVLTYEVQQDGQTIGTFTSLEDLEEAYLKVYLPCYQERNKTLWQKIKEGFKR